MRIFSRVNLLLILLFTITTSVNAQLNGNYTINSADLATSTNYQNLTSAISDMVSGTRADGGPVNGPAVSGPVVLRIVAGTGPYTEQITIPAIVGASASNTIRITGGGSYEEVNFTGTTTTDRHVIKLTGAKHIILDSLTIRNNDLAFGFGIHLTNLSDSNSINGCKVWVDSTSTSANFAGIVIGGAAVTTPGNWGNYNIIQNNEVNGGYYGISMRGTSTTVFCQSNRIINNEVRGFYFYGIYSYGQNLSRINSNVTRSRISPAAGHYGIYSGYNDRFQLNQNRVFTVGAYGIYIIQGNYQAAAPTSRAQVYNNMIGGICYGTTPYGLYITTNTRDVDFFHNSVSLTSGNGRCLYILSGSGNDIRNNIFSITNSTTGYALYASAITHAPSINYNDYYAPGSSNFIFIGSAYSTATYVGGGGFNTNSLNVLPGFTDPQNDLHITSSANLFDAGTNVGVNVDFDGDVRPLAPSIGYDIGADEFLIYPNDAAAEAVVGPVQPFAAGIQNVDVTIRNSGLNTLTSATINWQVNGALQPPFSWTGSLASNTISTSSTIGTFNFVSGNSYTIKVWTTLPNGIVDPNPSPDTVLVSVCTAMAGTYTVGGVTPDFATINDAVDALSCSGVSGPVVIRLQPGSGPFNEQVTIPFIAGTSAINTVRFTGGTAMETIANSITTTADRHVIKLNGADFIILDSLTIINTGVTFGYGIHLTNSADNNVISNNHITVNSISTSANFSGITISGATVASNGNHGDNNLIINNHVTGGYYGITARGLSTTVYDVGNRFLNNTILDSYYYGLYCYYQDTVVAENNEIIIRSTGSTAAYGAYFYYADRFSFQNNSIQQSGGNGFYTIYGNYQGGTGTSRAKIINNMIGGGYRGTTPYGIYLANNSRNIDIYNNSVSVDNGNGRALYITSGSGNNVLNNSFANFGSSTGYAAYVTSAANIAQMDYNNYFSDGSSNFVYIAGAYTPSTYIGAAGFNTNSVDGNPNYADIATDLHVGAGVQLFDNGVTIPEVTMDFDGDSRPMLPTSLYDIGADEYNADSIDVGLVSLLSPIEGLCPDSNVFAEVIFQNNGIYAVDSVTITLQITGAFSYSGSGMSTGITASLNSDTLVIGPFNSYPGGLINYLILVDYPGDSRPANDTLMGSILFGIEATAPVGVNDTICTGGVGSPYVNADGFGHKWFTAPVGGTLLGSGDTLSIGPLLNDTVVYVEGLSMTSNSITTSFAGGNGCSGNMFDVTSLGSNIIIDSLDLNIGSTASETVTLYYKSGSYVGFETSAAAWTAWDTIVVTGAGAGQPTRVVPVSSLNIPSGQLYGIYVTLASSNIDYTSASVLYTNTDITLQTGAGLCSAFGGVNAGRDFNGTLFYRAENCPSERVPVNVEVLSPPVADLGNDTSLCGTLSLNASHPNATEYLWSNSTTSPLGIFNGYFTGNISVTVSNPGCSDADTIVASINPLPNPYLGPDTSICSGDLLVLDPPDTLMIPSYVWSTSQTTPSITVSAPGTYWLYMEDFTGCGAGDTIIIGSNPLVGANFNHTLISGSTWQFTDVSTGTPDSWLWNFGDGQTSILQNPSHTYLTNGNYTVTLIVTNECGTDTFTTAILVNVGIEENGITNLYMYPNPTSDYLYVNMPVTGDATLSVLDVNGKSVRELHQSVYEGNPWVLDMSTLGDGLYMIRIQINEKLFVGRVIKK